MVQFESVTSEILLLWTNVARTNVAWTDVTVTVSVTKIFLTWINVSRTNVARTNVTTIIGTSVRRSSGRRSGVAVRAVECWQ